MGASHGDHLGYRAVTSGRAPTPRVNGQPFARPRPSVGARHKAIVSVTALVALLLAVVLGALMAGHPKTGAIVGLGVAAVLFVTALRPDPSIILLVLPVSLLGPVAFTLSSGGHSLAFTCPDVVIALALLAWGLRPASVPAWWFVANLTLIAWTCLSLLITTDMYTTVAGVKIALEASMVGLIAGRAVVVDVRRSVGRAVWAAASMSVAITAELVVRGGLNLVGQGGSEAALEHEISQEHNGFTTLQLSFGRSNYVGALILLGVLGLIAYWPWLCTNAQRTLALVFVAIGTLGVVITASRSQLISLAIIACLAAGLFVVVGSARRVDGNGSPASGLILIAVLGAGAYAISSYIGAIFAPVTEAGITSFGTVARRIEIWQSAWRVISHAPLFGVGVFDLVLPTPYRIYPTAHDTFLQVAAETGIPGLFIYLWALTSPIRHIRGQLRLTAFVVVAGLLVAGVAEPTLRTGVYDYVAWLLLGTLAAASAVPKREVSERTRPAMVSLDRSSEAYLSEVTHQRPRKPGTRTGTAPTGASRDAV